MRASRHLLCYSPGLLDLFEVAAFLEQFQWLKHQECLLPALELLRALARQRVLQLQLQLFCEVIQTEMHDFSLHSLFLYSMNAMDYRSSSIATNPELG
jgi:hypothetical protein